MMLNREQLAAEIAQEVIARLRVHMGTAAAPAPAAQNGSAARPQPAPGARCIGPGADGVFATVDDAVAAATEAQKKVAAASLEDRGK
jgi:hypothetical protein